MKPETSYSASLKKKPPKGDGKVTVDATNTKIPHPNHFSMLSSDSVRFLATKKQNAKKKKREKFVMGMKLLRLARFFGSGKSFIFCPRIVGYVVVMSKPAKSKKKSVTRMNKQDLVAEIPKKSGLVKASAEKAKSDK